MSLPLLSPSQPWEELFLYLAVSSEAVNATLVSEEDRVQKPVYYTSRALRGAEERYAPIEKLTFTLVIATRKLKPYFQAHTIIVLTDKPLRRAMNSPEVTERMALWAIELSEFDVQYHTRTTIKEQSANFIAEFTNEVGQRAKEVPQWNIHTDGSSNKQVGGAGVILLSPKGDKVECMIRLDFPTINNEAKYVALITGLDLAQAAGAENMVVYYDSHVATSQVNEDYDYRNEQMKKYLELVKD